MQFGLFHHWDPLYHSDGRLAEEEAYAANFKEVDEVERMGWDYIWLAGAHFAAHACMDPQVFVLASAIANRTKNIKIGSSIHRPELKVEGETLDPKTALASARYSFDNLQHEDPIQVAESVAMVDQLSHGRFIYGAGARTRGDDRRREHFFEYLNLLKQLWTEDQFSGFQGKYYNYPSFYETSLSIPKPYQKPYPPMLLPVDSQASFIPMGQQGYRIAIGGGGSHNPRGTSVLREDVENYRQAWRDAGHPGEPTTVIRIPTLVAETKAEAQRGADALMEEARKYAARLDLSFGTSGTQSVAETEQTNLFGTPDEVVERIQMLHDDFAADEIMFEVNWVSAVPRDVVLNTMRVVTDKVIPQFK